jgi:hypothetical protein
VLDLRPPANHPVRMNTRLLLSYTAAVALLTVGCNGSETTPPPPASSSTNALPAGHPPIGMGSQTLPAGHPPMDSGKSGMPAGHPPLDMSLQTLQASAKAAVETPQWTVPKNWTASAASSMRVATFNVAGEGKQSAEIAVSAFPGDVGGTLANINRWRGQLGLGPIKPEDVAGISTPIEAGDIKGTVVNLDAGAKRMLVATLPHGANSWFFKITGDAALVEAQKETFLGFVKSVKF